MLNSEVERTRPTLFASVVCSHLVTRQCHVAVPRSAEAAPKLQGGLRETCGAKPTSTCRATDIVWGAAENTSKIEQGTDIRQNQTSDAHSDGDGPWPETVTMSRNTQGWQWRLHAESSVHPVNTDTGAALSRALRQVLRVVQTFGAGSGHRAQRMLEILRMG